MSLKKIHLAILPIDTQCRTLFSGCDTGFGHEAALLLNRVGFKVFASCIDPNGEGAVRLMHKAEHPAKMVVMRMDVTNDKDIEVAFETVITSMANTELLFGLVNNAGIAKAAEFEWGPDMAEGQKIIDVNLLGMIKVTRKFLPLLRQAKGRILNVESMSSLIPTPHGLFYGTSKFGAAGFSDNLRIGMYRFGVSVVSINPWMYKTPISNAKMLADQYESSFRNSSDEVRNAYGENFLEKGKTGVSQMKFAIESNAVPELIVSALTVYEPDPRYIVAPIVMQPVLRLMLWLPKETLEAHYQIGTWFVGTHKVYPN